jgi:pantoate--beta-alanine ligase
MKTAKTIQEIRQLRNEMHGSVGFVPTMGFLHAGHISLVQAARSSCEHVIVSIFVNPTQFAPTEDLAAYPRDLQHDLELLKTAGVDLVWLPDNEIMYPDGFQTWVSVENLTKPLEGKVRPEHFRGVTTVVAKLFNVVQPQRAFFGQKDAQQAAVLQRMVLDLNFPIEMVICPIVREADNLALSSRNTYLTPVERRAGTVLSRSLFAARDLFQQGETQSAALIACMQEIIYREPLAKIQYISCADPLTLQEIDTIHSQALLSMAVYFGKTRLIDNLLLKPVD